MTEILESIVLAAGVCYLGYRVYSFFVLPILDLLSGKSGRRRSDARQPTLTAEPDCELQDVV